MGSGGGSAMQMMAGIVSISAKFGLIEVSPKYRDSYYLLFFSMSPSRPVFGSRYPVNPGLLYRSKKLVSKKLGPSIYPATRHDI
jgi:hypothetical protein